LTTKESDCIDIDELGITEEELDRFLQSLDDVLRERKLGRYAL